MRKIVLTYGLIAGAILSVLMLATMPYMDRIGYDSGMVIGYTTMVMAFLMIYFGVRSYRDNVLGGRIGFGRAFGTGMLITLVAGACYVATWEFVQYKFVPDFADKYAAHEIDKARREGATEAEIAAKSAEMAEFKEMYKNPLISIAFTFLEPLPVGLLFSLLSAAVHSRKRTPALHPSAG
jgi:hypothetical protein